MKTCLNILLEVNTIITKNLSIQNKRIVREKKRLLFLADIQSIEEGLVLNRTKTDYNDCVNLIMNSGEIIRCNENYDELAIELLVFWKRAQDIEKEEEKEIEIE